MSEAEGAMGSAPRIRPLMGGSGMGGMNRPGPYDRSSRFGMGGGSGMGMGGGGGMGGMGMGGYGMGRGGRNLKGKMLTLSTLHKQCMLTTAAAELIFGILIPYTVVLSRPQYAYF